MASLFAAKNETNSPAPAFTAAGPQPTNLPSQASSLPQTQLPAVKAAPPASPMMIQPAAATAAPSPQPSHSGAAGGKVKLPLANLVQGCTAEDLGFNPAMVPVWLPTTMDASILQGQAASGKYTVSLGTLLDGVADLGFRNMLTGAKRDFQVQLPSQEVFHALSGTTDAQPATPAPAVSAVLATPQAPAAALKTLVVQPGGVASPPPVGAEGIPASPMAKAPSQAQPTAAPTTIAFTPFGAPASPPTSSLPGASFFGTTPSVVGNSPPAAGTPPFPMAPEATKTALPAAKAVVQPMAGVFSAFSAPTVPAQAASSPSTQPSMPMVKAFDPFAPTPGSMPAAGLNSDQLLGHSPASAAVSNGGAISKAAKASQPLIDPFATSEPSPKTDAKQSIEPLIPLDAKPSAFFASPAVTPAENAPPRPMSTPDAAPPTPFFSAVKEDSPPPALAKSMGLFAGAVETITSALPELENQAGPPVITGSASLAPMPQAKVTGLEPPTVILPATARPASTSQPSFLGLSALDTETDQLLLRALLGVEDKLDASRIVQLLASQPGLSACVCLSGSSVLSHADASVPDAASFQQQAAEIARQLRGLAPLIGIEGAETFTLNAGGRLLTFCFPGSVTVGVLHRGEPGTGLRDKVTLVARELARMLR